MQVTSRLLRSSLLSSRLLRAAVTLPLPPPPLLFRRFASGQPTSAPSAFSTKGPGESNEQTAHPTTVQSHASTAETSKGGATPSPTNTLDPSTTVERYADAEPYQANWVDYRPDLVEVQVTRNEEGDLVGQWGGEDVIFPDLDTSLEWVVSTPVDTHLFEEVPIIKECPEDEQFPTPEQLAEAIRAYNKQHPDAPLRTPTTQPPQQH